MDNSSVEFDFHFQTPEPPKGLDLFQAAAYKKEAKRVFDEFSRLVSQFSQMEYQTPAGEKAYDLAIWLADEINTKRLLLAIADLPENKNTATYGIYELSENNFKKHKILAIVLPKNFSQIAGNIMPLEIGKMIEFLKNLERNHRKSLADIETLDFSRNLRWSPTQIETLKPFFVVEKEAFFSFDPDTGAPIETLTPERIRELKERLKNYPPQADNLNYEGLKTISWDHLQKIRSNKGWVEKIPWLKNLDEIKTALNRMPEGKRGIVVGSGQNTKFWKSKGWQTLDINPQHEPDYVLNAQQIEQKIPKQNFILAENLEGKGMGRGVEWKDFIKSAYAQLEEGGYLIIETLNQPGNKLIPDIEQMAKILNDAGFSEAVAELSSDLFSPKPALPPQQKVIYYAKKL